MPQASPFPQDPPVGLIPHRAFAVQHPPDSLVIQMAALDREYTVDAIPRSIKLTFEFVAAIHRPSGRPAQKAEVAAAIQPSLQPTNYPW